MFYLPETRDQFDFREYDYVVDAIDTVAGKLALIEAAKEAGTPIICAMGAGNKLQPSAFRVADIYDTSVCPLARGSRRASTVCNASSRNFTLNSGLNFSQP